MSFARLLVLSALIAYAVALRQTDATDVGGTILTNTTWTAANSPYIVTVDITVGNNATLSIEPGVTVKFNAGLGITIGSMKWGPGTLKAIGTESQKITFTSSVNPGAPGQWKDIFFTDFAGDAAFDKDEDYVSGSILQHCLVRYAGSGASEGGVTIDLSSPYLNACEITQSAVDGIRATNGSLDPLLVIENCDIHHNEGAGASLVTNKLRCRGNAIKSNSAPGLYVEAAGTRSHLEITENVVSDHDGIVGAAVTCNVSDDLTDAHLLFTDNSITDNHNQACCGGGLAVNTGGAGSVFMFTGNLFSGNSASTHGGGAFVGCEGGSHTVTLQGNTFSGNRSFYSGGGLYLARNWIGAIEVDLISNTFVGNEARPHGPRGDGFGGAILITNQYFFEAGLYVTFISNSVIENVAGGGSTGGIGRGGGMFVQQIGTDTYIVLEGDQGSGTYNVFRDNVAEKGAAIYNNLSFNKNGSNDIQAGYVCWGGLDPAHTANPDLIFDFFDFSAKSLVLYDPHVEGPDCGPTPSCEVGDVVTSATFQPPGDGQVDGADLAYLLGEWGANPGSLADIVTSATFQPPPDGIVDDSDLTFLLGAWGACE